MNFIPPRKCKRLGCTEFIESGRSDIEYCCRECQEKARYQENADKEKRLNAIKSQIRKMDKILERMFRIWGSSPIPSIILIKEGFKDGGYCIPVLHKQSDRRYRLLLDYAYFFNGKDQTIQIFTEHELRAD